MRANWPAELRIDGGARLECTVLDLSSAGARLRVEGEVGEFSHARLVIENLPPVAAVLAWRKRHQIGLRFIEEQGWVLELYTERFDPAAWLDRR